MVAECKISQFVVDTDWIQGLSCTRYAVLDWKYDWAVRKGTTPPNQWAADLHHNRNKNVSNRPRGIYWNVSREANSRSVLGIAVVEEMQNQFGCNCLFSPQYRLRKHGGINYVILAEHRLPVWYREPKAETESHNHHRRHKQNHSWCRCQPSPTSRKQSWENMTRGVSNHRNRTGCGLVA